MKNLLYKEFCLAIQPITFVFLLFTVMTFIPGYPILCGAFFICMGIFYSYQTIRENNDILYSVLLPVNKTDAVKAKFASAVILQLTAFALFGLFTLVRIMFMADAAVYTKNVLMNANFVFLAFVLVIFTAFNTVFIGGFFKTSYAYGKPFIVFTVVNFIIIAVAETLHHIPPLHWLNVCGAEYILKQIIILLAAVAVYITATVAAMKKSQKRFDNTDI